MKISVFLLFISVNFFSCNFNPLGYETSSADEESNVSSSPNNTTCLEENYEIKSEAAIAAMTPRQLIRELTIIDNDSFDTYLQFADYEKFIKKNIRKAGVGVLPLLTEEMNDYQPRSSSECDDLRFAIVKGIINDLDRFDFRLRGSKEGQLAIDAFERAIERMEMPEVNKAIIEYRNLFLKDLKGINGFDRAIQDTFWINKKIEISNDELLKFSNFLIDRDLHYPIRSNMDFIKDYSRINKAGNPSQVYILKKPEFFYEAYLDFKRIKR